MYSHPRPSRFSFDGLAVRQQPDDVTCGPTCLQAVYEFLGVPLSLDAVIESARSLDDGGTLGVLLGIDALERGFDATILTYNLDVFDPSWFGPRPSDVLERLRLQLDAKSDPRVLRAIQAYVDFVELGGVVRHRELTPGLVASLVERSPAPPITGLSATYLYGCQRERLEGRWSRYDDIGGEPVGHFVVISGVDRVSGNFQISDPSTDNPLHGSGTYWVTPHRLIGAILLGATTYDGNLLLIRPPEA